MTARASAICASCSRRASRRQLGDEQGALRDLQFFRVLGEGQDVHDRREVLFTELADFFLSLDGVVVGPGAEEEGDGGQGDE